MSIVTRLVLSGKRKDRTFTHLDHSGFRFRAFPSEQVGRGWGSEGLNRRPPCSLFVPQASPYPTLDIMRPGESSDATGTEQTAMIGGLGEGLAELAIKCRRACHHAACAAHSLKQAKRRACAGSSADSACTIRDAKMIAT